MKYDHSKFNKRLNGFYIFYGLSFAFWAALWIIGMCTTEVYAMIYDKESLGLLTWLRNFLVGGIASIIPMTALSLLWLVYNGVCYYVYGLESNMFKK